jgi:tRNA pseudouridine65 synthase
MHRFDILGDTHHGDWTLNRIITEKTKVKRLFLHAAELSFTHPQTNEKLNFDVKLPEEFDMILNTLAI